MNLWADISGIMGVIIINISYFMLNNGKLTSTDFSYAFYNLIGATLIIFSLIFEWNTSAFLMELSWISISIYGCLKALKNKKRA
jgi:hypothetical protein